MSENVRIQVSGTCRFYVNNPLDPTVRMYLPSKYDLEISNENNFYKLVSDIVDHMETIYQNKNIIVRPDIQYLESDEYLCIEYIIEIAAGAMCIEWFDRDNEYTRFETLIVRPIFKNPLNFDDTISGLQVEVYDVNTDSKIDPIWYDIPEYKVEDEYELRRLKFISYLLPHNAYYLLVLGTPDK